MKWWELLLWPLLPVVAWLRTKAGVLLAILAVADLVAGGLAWMKASSREAGYQQCRAELQVLQDKADAQREQRGAEVAVAASQAEAHVFSLNRLDNALQAEADHVPVVAAPRARAAACPAAAARPEVRGAQPVPVAPQQRDPGVEAVQPAPDDDGPDLSRHAVCLWNAASTSSGDFDAGDPDAAAAAIAEACAAQGSESSGVSVRDALKNHITNAISCQQDRARFDALAGPLRRWQAQDQSLEN